MDPTLKMSLVFIAILTCHLISTSSAIKIKITTNRYNRVVLSFDVTCTLDPDKSDHYHTKRIVAIKVSRHDQRPLAVLRQNSRIIYNRLSKANIKAKGHIDQDPRNTNMTVTFTDVMKEDSGVYNCTLLYFDKGGYTLQREEDGTNFTIENNNANDVVRYLVGELRSLKNKLAEIESKTTVQVEKDNNNEVVHIHLIKRLSQLERQQKELEDHTKEKDLKVETELELKADDRVAVRRQREKDIVTLKTQHEEGMDTLKTQHEEGMDTLKTQVETIENQTTKHITKDNNNEAVQTHLLKRLSEMEKQLRELEDHTKEKDAKVETGGRQHEKAIDTLKTQHVKQNAKLDALKKQHEKDIDTLNIQNVKHNEEINAMKKLHKEDIDTLKSQNLKQNEETDALKKQYRKDIDTLKSQHEKDINRFKTQQKKFEIQHTNQFTKVMDVVYKANDTETVRRQHEKDIDTLKTQLKTLENQTTNHITKANLQSGFVAGLQRGDSLLHRKTIQFRYVQLNIGNHFDAEVSQYTAPWDGLYAFFLTVEIRKGKYCDLFIRVNRRFISRLYANNSDDPDQSSVSAFVSLEAGDTVDVYGWDITGGAPLYGYPYPSTSFSGFLIKAT